MLNKHFFKTIFIFGAIIGVAILGIYLVNYFEENKTNNQNTSGGTGNTFNPF